MVTTPFSSSKEPTTFTSACTVAADSTDLSDLFKAEECGLITLEFDFCCVDVVLSLFGLATSAKTSCLVT